MQQHTMAGASDMRINKALRVLKLYHRINQIFFNVITLTREPYPRSSFPTPMPLPPPLANFESPIKHTRQLNKCKTSSLEL